MTVANKTEYREQVKSVDKQLEIKRGSISSRLVAQGTDYLESDIDKLPAGNSLAAKTRRLRDVSERLLNQAVSSNDLLHRGNGECSDD